MRGALLLMADDHHHHHFVNDWDLQAVVRSCVGGGAGGLHHPGTEPAAAAPSPRAEEGAAATRGDEAQARGQERAPPAVSDSRVARSSAAAAALPYDLEYLDLDHKPFLLPGDDGREREVMISFPAAAAAAAAAASTSSGGAQHRAVVPACRKPGARTPRPKRSKKSQLKKVVREMPVADGGGGASSSSDPWAWRKYGQKPIKGSPYPRGYYKCSSMKGCMARKLVERSPAKPGVLVVTYMADHCHPVPTQLNALAGTTRHKPSSTSADAASSPASPKSQEHGTAAAERAAGGGLDHEGYETSAAAMVGGAEAVDDDGEFWPVGMDMDLDELLAPVDDDLDFDHVTDEDGVLERRLSL